MEDFACDETNKNKGMFSPLPFDEVNFNFILIKTESKCLWLIGWLIGPLIGLTLLPASLLNAKWRPEGGNSRNWRCWVTFLIGDLFTVMKSRPASEHSHAKARRNVPFASGLSFCPLSKPFPFQTVPVRGRCREKGDRGVEEWVGKFWFNSTFRLRGDSG